MLAKSDKSQRAAALHAMAAALLAREKAILAANARDVEAAVKSGAGPAFVDRLKLSSDSVRAMATGIEAVIRRQPRLWICNKNRWNKAALEAEWAPAPAAAVAAE